MPFGVFLFATLDPASVQHTEPKERRTPNSKTYYDQHYNRYITHVSTHDIHYLSDDGVYKPISPYLRTYPDGQWGVYKAPYRTRLADRLGEGKYDVRVELPDGGLLQWRVVSLGYYDSATGEFATIESARPVELQNGSDVAIYPGIFSGIDYRVVHENTGVRQEFVRSPRSRRELPQPAAFGVAEGELAIRIQFRGDYEWSDVLPFRNERGYLSLDERDGLLLSTADPSGASTTSEVLLEMALSVKPDKAPDDALQFDLETSGVPKNATILSARVLDGGMNREVKEQAQHWLAEPESNRGLTGLQQTQTATTSQAQMVVEWVDNSSKVYYLKDHLGSVRATVNEVGAVVSYDDYDPWGLTLAGRSMTSQGSLPNKFTGKERDTDFGLDWDYFGARFYMPEIGRWGSVDPLARRYPAWSPYNYGLANSINQIDLDGREVWKIIAYINAARKLARRIEQTKRFQSLAVASRIGGVKNGRADAWRHAAWSKETSEKVGRFWAFLFGVAHEIENLIDGEPLEDKRYQRILKI